MYVALRRLYGLYVHLCTDLRNVRTLRRLYNSCAFNDLCMLRVQRLVHAFTVLHRLYNYCALSGLCIHIHIFALEDDCTYRYVFCMLSGLLVCIPLLRFRRLVRTDTASRFFQRLGDSVFRIRRFFRRINDLILRVIDLSNVCVTVLIDRPEDPAK